MRAMDRWISPLRRTAAVLGMLLCASIGLAQTQSQPAKVMVDDVIPQGLHAVPSQKVMSLIRTRPGTEYQQDTVNDDVRRIYETKLFANVRVQLQRVADNKVKVYFILAEYPSTVQEVIFRGAKHLKQEELETITGLRKGMPLNPLANRMARETILRRYYEMGRLFAGVELVEGDKPGDTRVVFNITEGRVVRIKSIEFVGNHFVSTSRLRLSQIDTSSAFLGMGGTLEIPRVDHDVTKLEEYYRGWGFKDVRVAREIRWDEDYNYVHVVFHIQEGTRYQVTNVQVEGNKILNQDELLERSKLRRGEFYNKGMADTDIQVIQAMYGYRGYGVTVREQDFYPGPGEVAVHYDVQEKPPAKVGEIQIIGDNVTKQNVIMRQIPLYPGQILTYPDLKLAEKNLARLNIFEMDPSKGGPPHVSIAPDQDEDSEFKKILVKVDETQTGSLMFGVGVNSDAGLTGSIVLNERNFDICNWPTSLDELFSGRAFRGAGQELRIEAVPGTEIQRYSATFREPYLFDSLFGFTASAYYQDQIYNEYEQSTLGARFTLSRRLNQYWSVSGGIGVEEIGIHNVQSYEPEEFQEIEGDHFLASVRGIVTRDARDSYLRATSGSLAELTVEEFFGDYTFPRITLDASKYFTIYQRPDNSGRQVLVARTEIGWAGNETPIFERFYAGGFRSMRGFEFRMVGPQDEGFFTGGDFEFLNSLEYQIPILANDYLYGVLFVDSGTVESDVEINHYRVSAGFGLRIVVPMLGPVPIALDFGFPIVKASGDKEQVFSFWVGFFH